MKNTFIKKAAALLLALALLSGTMAGCGGENNSSSSSKAESNTPASSTGTSSEENSGASASEPGETSAEPVTLTAFKNGVESPPNWEWGMDPVSQRITERTGVTLDITCAATDDNTELTTMLAAGADLPDFIITNAYGPMRSLLVDQGFALPLNELADQYDPSFWDTLPTDMDKIYQEEDGNFYCVVDWYGDPERYDQQIINSRGPISITLKKEFYDEIGRPEIKTWDEYKSAIKEIMAAHPEVTNGVWTDAASDPFSNSNMINLFARMYGANNTYFEFKSDGLEMVMTQPYYKDALKLANNLYQEGLFNAEQFAYKQDQTKGVYKAQNLVSFIGYYWTLIDGIGNTHDVIYETIEYPMPDGRSGDDLKIHDDYFGVGSNGVFVTTGTEHPDRCIQYLNFMLSDEGQLLQRYGVEGVTWEKDDEGRPKDTQTKIDADAQGTEVLQREYGVYNYNFSWLTSNTILVYGAHNTYQNYPCMLPDFEIMTPHQQDERFADLTVGLTNTDELVLKEQIWNIWKSGVANTVSAADDAAFEAAYEKFMSDLNTAGIEKLCGYFQANAEKWAGTGLTNPLAR